MLFSKETPWRRLEGMSFGLFSADEIRKLSVKSITNSQLLDNVGNAAANGLYDLALGPADNKEICSTCMQDYTSCPGHFGLVDLPLPVYNPMFFDKLYLLIRGSCLGCHMLKCPRTAVHLLLGQLKLLDVGAMKEVYELENVLNQLLEVNAKPSGIEIQEALEAFISPVLKASDDKQQTAPIKHICEKKSSLINSFWRVYMGPRKCPNCRASRVTVRREHNSKLIIIHGSSTASTEKDGKSAHQEWGCAAA
ncbi:DNA-directed RNA polymerase I subunit RPA1-like [Sinocyclocheilus rhinocerous]|uniref:DNA-directed RNA polymerase I subunit RPA1-like n=1 Tax=Sinocyclocheilus rhinocerous TaxID=307959 RepID=UPI0007B97B52|nr:PREDICTED: DNA-directed RNA polymerase I subunit RPA1-like [Sinocyclocheilus rhinocerous]